MKIKVKLIFLFIVIKVIPLLAISYIAYAGVMKLDNYLKSEKIKTDREIALKEIQVKMAEIANRRAISKDNVLIARTNKN